MELRVIKIGAVMFDMLHALGLAILLASVTLAEVEIVDEGYCFRIRSLKIVRRMPVEQCIRSILEIPSIESVRAYAGSSQAPTLPVLNLDGLLAFLYTSRGIRAVSVQDALNKVRLNPESLEQSSAKVASAIERWIKETLRTVNRQVDWIDQLLESYADDQPITPIPIVKGKHGISISSTIGACFGYSTRRPLSDGMVERKTQILLVGTLYAVLLAIFGAARCLRAHHIAGNLVIFYLPRVEAITLSADIALPLLNSSDQAADHTLVQQWLGRAWRRVAPNARWSGLVYQIMQTQGAKQSISRATGYLDYAWLTSIEERISSPVIDFWCKLLAHGSTEIGLNLNYLIDSLLTRNIDSWIEHLSDVARQAETSSRLYHFFELKGITTAMTASSTNPLREILECDQGTLKFGRALRQLGRINRGVLRDAIDELSVVHDLVGLMNILYQVLEQCYLAKAKDQFIILPDEEDLGRLSEDVQRHGVRVIASSLMVLSAVRYPRAVSEQIEANNASHEA